MKVINKVSLRRHRRVAVISRSRRRRLLLL